MAKFQMGPKTLAVPMSMFKDNRSKLVTALKGANSNGVANSIVLLEGGDNISLYDTDVDYVFRQVSEEINLFISPFIF